jgi:hypothetical protein
MGSSGCALTWTSRFFWVTATLMLKFLALINKCDVSVIVRFAKVHHVARLMKEGDLHFNVHVRNPK